jgi:hypothetical protein
MAGPIACSLTPGQLRDRKASLLPGLLGRATLITPHDNGYRLQFAAGDRDVVTGIAACIDAERHCCPFLSFSLSVPAEAAPIELDVTGPSGTRAFLDALLA